MIIISDEGSVAVADLHESDSYFEHVVAQREIAETVPCVGGASTHTALCIMEVFLGVLVEAGHCGMYREREDVMQGWCLRSLM